MLTIHPRITSYVNNLHPVHQEPLYHLLEEIITASIPMWELSLAPSTETHCTIGTRVSYSESDSDSEELEVEPRHWPEEEGPQLEIGEGDSNKRDSRRRIQQWSIEATSFTMPDPDGTFEPIKRPEPDFFANKFKDQGLQVIVKLANIHLTPDKPAYKGGSWHVEGQLVSLSLVSSGDRD